LHANSHAMISGKDGVATTMTIRPSLGFAY